MDELPEAPPKPHPLAHQQLTPEEWRAVGDFIKTLIAERQSEGIEPESSF